MDFNPGYPLKSCKELLRNSRCSIKSVVALLRLQMSSQFLLTLILSGPYKHRSSGRHFSFFFFLASNA